MAHPEAIRPHGPSNPAPDQTGLSFRDAGFAAPIALAAPPAGIDNAGQVLGGCSYDALEADGSSPDQTAWRAMLRAALSSNPPAG
jgi:hypothetical protein